MRVEAINDQEPGWLVSAWNWVRGHDLDICEQTGIIAAGILTDGGAVGPLEEALETADTADEVSSTLEGALATARQTAPGTVAKLEKIVASDDPTAYGQVNSKWGALEQIGEHVYAHLDTIVTALRHFANFFGDQSTGVAQGVTSEW